MSSKMTRKEFVFVLLIAVLTSSLILIAINGPIFQTASTPETERSPSTLNYYLYLSVQGETQGLIQGDVTEAGLEGKIGVLQYTHSIYTPREASSGMATGERRHQPLILVKEIDKSSPKLALALVNNEELTVNLLFYKETTTKDHYFTIKLEFATIVSIQSFMPREMASDAVPMEEVTLNYSKITWIHVATGVEVSDVIVDTPT